MRLYLIGLPGSGKSVLAKKLSGVLKVPVFDLDDFIEVQEGVKISEIFSTKGQEYFRTLEAEALRKKSESREFVMATGGGTPCFYSNMDFINQTGISIFLDTPVTEIVKRMDESQRKLRPLLENEPDEKMEQALDKFRQSRLSFYRQANFTINLTNIEVNDVLELIDTKKYTQ